ncbi:hypothetical protein CEK25_012459 [Fusarium fujikuroi]|nr:hypothetical protein CEK25_012459 [Fusarium fujikuroi]
MEAMLRSPTSSLSDNIIFRPYKHGHCAPRACLSCRARKVRCDGARQGWPCSNCTWHQCECKVGSRKDKYAGTKFRHGSSPIELVKNLNRTGITALLGTQDRAVKANNDSVSFPQNEHRNNVPRLGPSPDKCRDRELTCIYPKTKAFSAASCVNPSVLSSPPGQAYHVYDGSEECTQPPSIVELEPFLIPLPQRIRTDDIAYLKSRGALTIPPLQIRDALLRSYFTYVHPFMPAIDMDEFLGAIEYGGKNQRISFLLFQAVMFAGAACTPMCYLEKLGFSSRKGAREELFIRVRFLYDLDYETDRLALVQSLLLMTLWYKSPEEHRNTWHWLDVAISQAFAMGLHLDPDETTLSHRECILRRKVWWSCYVTDRLVSLNMKRPPRIRDDDFHVTMLLGTDFQPNLPLEDCQVRLNDMCPYVADTKLRSTLVGLFVELACLCQLMDPILRLHRSIQLGENNTLLSCNSEKTKFNGFRLISIQNLSALKQKMTEWIDSTQSICNYEPSTGSEFTYTTYLQQTALRLTFQAVMLQAHRLTIILSEEHDDYAEAEEAKSGILDSARQVSNLASEVIEKGLCSFLPPSILGALVNATAVFIKSIRFMQCLEAITIMEEIYEPARMARQTISWALVGPWNASKLSSIEMNQAEVMLAHQSQTPYSKGESSSPDSLTSHDTETNTPSIATSLWSSDLDHTGELGTVLKAWGFIAKEEVMIEHQEAEIDGLSAISMEGLGVLNDFFLSIEFRKLSYNTRST